MQSIRRLPWHGVFIIRSIQFSLDLGCWLQTVRSNFEWLSIVSAFAGLRRCRHRAAIQESTARSDLPEVAPEKRPSRWHRAKAPIMHLYRALRRGGRFALLRRSRQFRRNCRPWRLSASGLNAASPLLTYGCTSARARHSSTSIASRCPAGVTAWFFIPGLNFLRALRSGNGASLLGPVRAGCPEKSRPWQALCRRVQDAFLCAALARQKNLCGATKPTEPEPAAHSLSPRQAVFRLSAD